MQSKRTYYISLLCDIFPNKRFELGDKVEKSLKHKYTLHCTAVLYVTVWTTPPSTFHGQTYKYQSAQKRFRGTSC